jgi:antitoxin (DNA-binding transcriptional repressor) of toxin-antitoxin stability system
MLNMVVMNIKEARRNFSRLIERAELGERIVIARRGREVVSLDRISRSGMRLPSLADFRKEIKVKGDSLSDAIIRDRQDGRF